MMPPIRPRAFVAALISIVTFAAFFDTLRAMFTLALACRAATVIDAYVLRCFDATLITGMRNTGTNRYNRHVMSRLLFTPFCFYVARRNGIVAVARQKRQAIQRTSRFEILLPLL